MKNINFEYRSSCEICNSNRKIILYSKNYLDDIIWNFIDNYYNNLDKKYFVDAKYEVVKCLKCGFIWQSHILNDYLMDKLYDSWISASKSLDKKKKLNIENFVNYAHEIEAISLLLKKKPYKISVLDWGMGWGFWAKMAKAFNYNVYGFEISNKRIQYAGLNGIKVINNYEQIDNYKYDYINVDQVFEHIKEPAKKLKYLLSCLKPNGIIKISVPNGKNIERDLKINNWKPKKGPIQPLEHINCFFHKSLINMSEICGLRQIKHPIKIKINYGLYSFLKSLGSKYYNQHFGTSLYFIKDK